MRQDEFIFKVEKEGEKIIVSTYDIGGVFIIEENLIKLYPQLENIKLTEKDNGIMSYEGDMEIQELKIVLDNWGFIVEHSDRHVELLAGKSIDCKIEPRYDEVPYYHDYTRPVVDGVTQPPLERKSIEQLQQEMEEAAENDNFDLAIQIREEIKRRQDEE
jgi:hypothetical protein